jgi:hypothetical protein
MRNEFAECSFGRCFCILFGSNGSGRCRLAGIARAYGSGRLFRLNFNED